MHFVYDDEARERSERCHGLIQAGQAEGVLKIEVVRRAGFDELTRERRLTALPSPDERHDRVPPEGVLKDGRGGSGKQFGTHTLKLHR